MPAKPDLAGQSLLKNPAFWILGVLLSIVYFSFFVFEAEVKVELETDAQQPTFFKIYWAKGEQNFSESRMGRVRIDARQKQYRLMIASLDEIDRLRIDPIEYVGQLQLTRLRITQLGYQTIDINAASEFNALRPLQQIEKSRIETGQGLSITTAGPDGQLELALKPVKQSGVLWMPLLTLASLLALLALSMRLLQPLLLEYRFVPHLAAMGVLLALVMAALTGLNIHPDEVVHLAAVSYYAQHFLPPALNSDLIADSFSVYGFSRLGGYEIYYPLAGYFQTLIAGLQLSELGGARAFGLGLFALLAVISALHRPFRVFALPLIVSAQIWYIFSYTNSDGFALALTLFVAYLAAWPHSLLNRFLSDATPCYYALKLVGLGLLLGMLLLLKVNYYFFVLFLGLYLLWRVWCGDFPEQKRLWTRILLLTLVGLSLYGARFALDISANGWNGAETQAQLQEQHAKLAFKPSTALDQQQPLLHLKDRGRPLGYVAVTSRWFEKTFESAFGVYGFSDYVGPLAYYDLVRLIGLALMLTLLLALIRSRNKQYYVLALAGLACSGALIMAGIWHSWTVIFQPQGRYLLPVLPMLSIFYQHIRQHAIPQLIEWLCIALFGLAAYSFICVGLRDVAKLSY